MTNPNDPVMAHQTDDWATAVQGLTKREYFAAMAMQGLAVNPGNAVTYAIARDACALADALIEALNK